MSNLHDLLRLLAPLGLLLIAVILMLCGFDRHPKEESFLEVLKKDPLAPESVPETSDESADDSEA